MADKSTHLFLGGAPAGPGKPPQAPVELSLAYANRHGLIAGATGTGKTVTVQILAEGFSRAGVPVFVADVKGDLSGLAASGGDKDFLTARASLIGLEGYEGSAVPAAFWDLFGEKGHPIRATATEMGPLLLSRMLDLNDTQEGVLSIAFRVADAEGWPVLDLEDLRALLVHVAEERQALSLRYGNISAASVAAIQRRLLQLEDQGAAHFFGEPKLDLKDFLRTDEHSHGVVNILAADRLMRTPKLYGIFLLWLISELFEELPEVGDPEKPKLVFFFDEAHLLFDAAPDGLLERIEQVVRLIRSKGVGIYFATQNPADVPDSVSSQLGNRFQHALRAFTPKEKRGVKAAAETFRANPDFDAEETIMELGVGEALVSTLQKKGVPDIVRQTMIRPPTSRLGPLTAAERKTILANSPLSERYDQVVNRESAAELLAERADKKAAAAQAAERRSTHKERSPKKRRSSSRSSLERAAQNALNQGTRTLVRELVRGFLGGLKRR